MPTRLLGLGQHALGEKPLAGLRVYSAATVTVTPFGTVTTGGPDLLVEWTFSQPESVPQGEYKVVLNDGSTDVYDTGWVASDQTQHQIPFDSTPLTGEISGGTVTVYARMTDQYGGYVPSDASDIESITVQWGQPHCTINVPDGVTDVVTPQVTVEWSFTDTRAGKTQTGYRVRLLDASDNELYDTGWVASSASQATIPYTLQSNTTYKAEVQLENTHGIRSD